MRRAIDSLTAPSASARSLCTTTLRSAPSTPPGSSQSSARPADNAPRPSSHSEGPRQRKLEAAAESDGQHIAESDGQSATRRLATLTQVVPTTNAVSDGGVCSRSPGAHHSLRPAHHSLRGAESDGQLPSEPSVATAIAREVQGRVHDGAVEASGDGLDGAASVAPLDAHHSLRLAHQTLRHAESGGQPGSERSVDGRPAGETRGDDHDDPVATGPPPAHCAVEAAPYGLDGLRPPAHPSLRVVDQQDGSVAWLVEGDADHTDQPDLVRAQDVWVTFRDPEAEASFHARGQRTRPAITPGDGAGCNTAGLRAACNTLWVCPCGCDSLVSRVEAIGAANAARPRRVHFDDGDGNAARVHTTSFHLGRFCDRLAARGRGLLARTHLLIRRPASVSEEGAWIVNTAETEQVARGAIALSEQLRGGAPQRGPHRRTAVPATSTLVAVAACPKGEATADSDDDFVVRPPRDEPPPSLPPSPRRPSRKRRRAAQSL